MQKTRNNIMKVTMIILILVIIILVGIIIKILNTNNEINRQKERNTQQLEETTTDNAYISMETHLSALDEKQKEINNMQNTAGQTTVTADKILKDYTAYKDGKLITGTMANNGAVTKTLNAGGSYTIPAGYHNGSGKVTANSLASQTSATATASDISSGKTAWVNGKLITGNGSYSNFSFVETKTLYSGYRVASGSKTFTLNKGKYYIVFINVYTGGSDPIQPSLFVPTVTIDNGNIEIISEKLVTTAIVDVNSGGAIITVNYTGYEASEAKYTHKVYASIYKS